MSRFHPLALCLLVAFSVPALAAPDVSFIRVPDNGLQPQVVVAGGVVHLIYFRGEPLHGNLFYVRSTDFGKTFSPPIRVNSQAGSAIATGTIRGGQIALGRGGRVHVAWNGSDASKLPSSVLPMLYTRLDDTGRKFEPQRNVITQHFGLDGGGSLAADAKGNVFIAWHAPETHNGPEADRRIWIARSADDGKTFSPEVAASPNPTGACACCQLKLFVDSHGQLFILYRTAMESVHRDMYLLHSGDGGSTFNSVKIAPMKLGQCIMSTASFIEQADGLLVAWETNGRVFWSKANASGLMSAGPISPSIGGKIRKYPALATNADGAVLIAWADGVGWSRGGSVAWQLFNANGQPIAGDQRPGLAASSLPAVFTTDDGAFVVLY